MRHKLSFTAFSFLHPTGLGFSQSESIARLTFIIAEEGNLPKSFSAL
jgi:peroxiredoxin